MAQFNRDEFRKRVAEKAKLAAKQKMVEKVQTLSEEEKQVLKAYKEWKEKKIGAAPKVVEKTERVEAIKAKIQEKKERQARIAKLQKKLAEKRQAKVAGNDVAAKVKALKEKIEKVKAKLSEEELLQEPAMAAGSPLEGGLDMAPEAAPQLPPEVVAEIQNIVSAVDALAAMAGIQKEPTIEQGPDIEAAIPGQVAAPGAAPEAPMFEKTKKVKEEEEAPAEAAPEGEAMAEGTEIDQVRARIARRREALKAIRAKALEEGYDGVVSGKEVLSDMTPVITVPEARLGYTANPKKGDDPSMKGTATLKAGKTWPTKPAPAKKTFEVQEAEEAAPAEGEEKMEESWDQKHIDRFLEKKQLNFRDLLKSGNLG